jgi:phosphoketolase
MALVEKLMMCPFDMVVLDKLSRFHLAMDALKYVPRLRSRV